MQAVKDGEEGEVKNPGVLKVTIEIFNKDGVANYEIKTSVPLQPVELLGLLETAKHMVLMGGKR